MHRNAILLPALLLAAPLSLGAAAEQRLGLELFTTRPTGAMINDYLTDATGLGGGVFADWEMDDGNTFRWVILRFTEHGQGTTRLVNPSGAQADYGFRARRAFTGFEVHWAFRDEPLGPHLIAGIGLGRIESRSRQTPGAPPSHPSDTEIPIHGTTDAAFGTRLAWVGGFGYRFTESWSAQVRATGMSVSGRPRIAIEAGLACRF